VSSLFILEKHMAVIAVTMDHKTDYVSNRDPAKKMVQKETGLKNDQGEELFDLVEEIDWDLATVFELGPLDQRTYTRILDGAMNVTQGSGIQMKTNQSNYEVVQYGLKGWRNFVDGNGKQLPFLSEKKPVGSATYTVATDQTLSALGSDMIKELAAQIKLLSQVSVEQVKN